MCLGIPGKIIEILPDPPETAGGAPAGASTVFGLRRGIVDFGGVRKEVCLSCVEDALPGDYVIVHVGFAISKVDPEEAQEVFRLLAEIEAAGSGPGGEPAENP